jgi:hypothetical protein
MGCEIDKAYAKPGSREATNFVLRGDCYAAFEAPITTNDNIELHTTHLASNQ